MAKNWKAWLAAGSASLGVLFASVQLLGADDENKPNRTDNTPTLHGGIISNPFKTSSLPHSENKDEMHPPAQTVPQNSAAEPALDKNAATMQREARFFLDKYATATTALGKFDGIGFVLDSLKGDIKNAYLIGMQPAQLARLIRDTAYQALPEIQAQTPATDFDKLMKVNLIRIAIQNISLMDDGTYNATYGAQMSGIDTERNNNEKIGLAFSAGQEAVAALQTAPDPSSMSYDQLTRYQNMVNVIKYVEFSDELRQHDRDNSNRLERIGINYDKLAELKEKIFDPLNNEVNRRIDEFAQHPQSRSQQHPMLPRITYL
ncbi:MAG: hypothetical protein HYS17_05440 [Micavibrio aeruginosavorus]|uniref:Uncharacterized protein n=1 Tax=Micavibrio aeruginosavorus TaxID=349221 RepID=A0A7T5R449_9BACT|nr:MAG: hypothetical protein HYS17_05440 [Micavibrio aeruginosavorus]